MFYESLRLLSTRTYLYVHGCCTISAVLAAKFDHHPSDLPGNSLLVAFAGIGYLLIPAWFSIALVLMVRSASRRDNSWLIPMLSFAFIAIQFLAALPMVM